MVDDNKRQDQKWLSAYSRLLCIYNYLLFMLIKLILGVRSLGSKACGRISTVLGISKVILLSYSTLLQEYWKTR